MKEHSEEIFLLIDFVKADCQKKRRKKKINRSLYSTVPKLILPTNTFTKELLNVPFNLNDGKCFFYTSLLTATFSEI